jgi:hypothetical protein
MSDKEKDIRQLEDKKPQYSELFLHFSVASSARSEWASNTGVE